MIKYSQRMNTALILEYDTGKTKIQVFETNGIIAYRHNDRFEDERMYIVISTNIKTKNELVRYGSWAQVKQILKIYHIDWTKLPSSEFDA